MSKKIQRLRGLAYVLREGEKKSRRLKPRDHIKAVIFLAFLGITIFYQVIFPYTGMRLSLAGPSYMQRVIALDQWTTYAIREYEKIDPIPKAGQPKQLADLVPQLTSKRTVARVFATVYADQISVLLGIKSDIKKLQDAHIFTEADSKRFKEIFRDIDPAASRVKTCVDDIDKHNSKLNSPQASVDEQAGALIEIMNSLADTFKGKAVDPQCFISALELRKATDELVPLHDQAVELFNEKAEKLAQLKTALQAIAATLLFTLRSSAFAAFKDWARRAKKWYRKSNAKEPA